MRTTIILQNTNVYCRRYLNVVGISRWPLQTDVYCTLQVSQSGVCLQGDGLLYAAPG